MEPDMSAPHVYKVSNPVVWYVTAVIVAVLGISVMGGGVRGLPPSPVTAIIGLVVVALALYLVYFTVITRLTVSAEGLALRGPIGITTASWDQVQEIRTVRSRGGHSTFLILSADRGIAVAQFGGIAPDSALGQDLRRYIPQLFKADL